MNPDSHLAVVASYIHVLLAITCIAIITIFVYLNMNRACLYTYLHVRYMYMYSTAGMVLYVDILRVKPRSTVPCKIYTNCLLSLKSCMTIGKAGFVGTET